MDSRRNEAVDAAVAPSEEGKGDEEEGLHQPEPTKEMKDQLHPQSCRSLEAPTKELEHLLLEETPGDARPEVVCL